MPWYLLVVCAKGLGGNVELTVSSDDLVHESRTSEFLTLFDTSCETTFITCDKTVEFHRHVERQKVTMLK